MTSELQHLMAAHNAALVAFDAQNDDEYDKDNDVVGKTVDLLRDAILAHRPTLDEVPAKAEFMLRNRTFTEWDNFEQRRIIEALTPVPMTISQLIYRHKAEWIAFGNACEATDDAAGTNAEAAAKATQDAAGEVTHDALWAIIEHPYASIDELRQGILYLAEHHRSTGDGDPQEWFTSLACSVAGIKEDGL